LAPAPDSKEILLTQLAQLPVGSWGAPDLLGARESLGFTQAELAAAIGYDRSAIAKLEGGDAPPRRVVELAIRYLIDRRPQGEEFIVRLPEEARFVAEGESLGVNESGLLLGPRPEVFLEPGPSIWLRLLPKYDSGRRFNPMELRKAATAGGLPLVQLIDGYSNLGFVRGTDGFGVYGILQSATSTNSVSYAFGSGECWAVDTYLINALKQNAGPIKIGIPYLEGQFKLVISEFKSMMNKLDFAPPYRWIAGIEGIKGFGLYYPARPGHAFMTSNPHGHFIGDRVLSSGIMDATDTPSTALRPFFVNLFSSAGIDRPDHLDGLSNPR
jgi:transcriptional regulator with XRE-family HTH domain